MRGSVSREERARSWLRMRRIIVRLQWVSRSTAQQPRQCLAGSHCLSWQLYTVANCNTTQFHHSSIPPIYLQAPPNPNFSSARLIFPPQPRTQQSAHRLSIIPKPLIILPLTFHIHCFLFHRPCTQLFLVQRRILFPRSKKPPHPEAKSPW